MRTELDKRLLDSIQLPAMMIACFWLVLFFERASGFSLSQLGILPREAKGVAGIVLSPFLHGGLKHILSNTGSFFILLTGMIYFYPKASKIAFPSIYLLTGMGVWLFGRGSYLEAGEWRSVYHIGASGLIYGFAAFLFIGGLLRHDKRGWAISLVVGFLYQSMLYGLVPDQPGISWESHLIGAIVGAGMAVWLRKLDPLPKDPDEESDDAPHTGYRPLQNKYIRYTYIEKK